jgi:hypothetical protein
MWSTISFNPATKGEGMLALELGTKGVKDPVAFLLQECESSLEAGIESRFTWCMNHLRWRLEGASVNDETIEEIQILERRYELKFSKVWRS